MPLTHPCNIIYLTWSGAPPNPYHQESQAYIYVPQDDLRNLELAIRYIGAASAPRKKKKTKTSKPRQKVEPPQPNKMPDITNIATKKPGKKVRRGTYRWREAMGDFVGIAAGAWMDSIHMMYITVRTTCCWYTKTEVPRRMQKSDAERVSVKCTNVQDYYNKWMGA